MTGGYLQLVAKGSDDIYIINNPQITLFKIIYRRHANFAMFPFYLNFARKMNFGTVGRCRIRKHGDLVNKLTLIVKLPAIKMKYPTIIKKDMQIILLAHGIVWEVPENELNNAVTIDDYNDIEVLATAHIQALMNDNTVQKERMNVMNTEFENPNNKNGREYANSVFVELIKEDPFEVLITYLIAFNNDLLSPQETVYNSDEVIIAFFNSLITKLIVLNPTYPLLSENIIFYQVVEFGNYVFNQSLLNYNMKYIFDKALEFGYAINGIDITLDSYLVYNKYFMQLPESRQFIGSQNDINITLAELLSDLNSNFSTNILQLINILTLLKKNLFDIIDQYRVNIFKKFKFITVNIFNGSDLMNVLSNGNNAKLIDNFTSILFKNINISNNTFRNYFGNVIANAINEFNGNLRETFRIDVLQQYFGDINIWNMLKLSIFGPIYSSLDSVYIMNLIPYYVIDSIPLMVKKYLSLDPNLSIYTAQFDLVGSTFSTNLKSALAGMYLAYNITANGDVYSYLLEFNTVYRSGSDVLLTALLKPEIILDIDTSSYSGDVISRANALETAYDSSIELSTNKLLPIEFVIHSYILKYIQMIFIFTGDQTLRTALINFIIIEIVNRFRTQIINPNDSIIFPSYTSFKNNNFSLFKINSAVVQTSISTIPEFLDAASSIWYFANHEITRYFNILFRNVLLSPKIYEKELGGNMNAAITEFTNLLILNGIDPGTNYENVDFYKLQLSGTIYDPIITYLTNMYNAYNTMFLKYQSDKKMFKIKDIAISKSKNYYRRFEDIFELIRQEILNNPSIYYPLDLSITPDPTIIINQIETDLLNMGFIGSIDIKYMVRADIINAISNAVSMSNPYPIGSNLNKWFSANVTRINSALLHSFDSIMSFMDDNNSSNQYSDPDVIDIYGKLSNFTFVLSYMIDLVTIESGLSSFISGIVNNNKGETHNNFLGIVELQIKDNNVTLLSISALDSSGNPTGVFAGSVLSKSILKFTVEQVAPFAWVRQLGHRLIERIHVEIGGQVIEEHTSDWLREATLIFLKANYLRGYNIMIGNVPELYTFRVLSSTVTGNSKEGYTLYIPLIFWFNNYYSESLPLIAMKYTDIDVVVKFRELVEVAMWDKNATFVTKPDLVDCRLLANYVYVDTDERERLAIHKHEYLMENLQHNGELIIGKNNIDIGAGDMSMTIKAFFSNSCKFVAGYLKFIPVRSDEEILNIDATPDVIKDAYKGFSTDKPVLGDFDLTILDTDAYDWTNDKVIINGQTVDPVIDMRIKFNGHDRENQRDFGFYEQVHPNVYNKCSLDKNMFIYNFCVNPADLQPSGSVNMGQINDFMIIFYLNSLVYNEIINGRMRVRVGLYNYSYNWLRISSGMAAPLFFG